MLNVEPLLSAQSALKRSADAELHKDFTSAYKAALEATLALDHWRQSLMTARDTLDSGKKEM